MLFSLFLRTKRRKRLFYWAVLLLAVVIVLLNRHGIRRRFERLRLACERRSQWYDVYHARVTEPGVLSLPSVAPWVARVHAAAAAAADENDTRRRSSESVSFAVNQDDDDGSAIFCVGKVNATRRTCAMRNVCYDTRARAWNYYMRRGELSQMTPEEREMMRGVAFARTSIAVPDNDAPFGVRIRSLRELPRQRRSIDDATRVRWLSSAQTHVLLTPFYPENFGHALGDDLFAVVDALGALGLPHEPPHVRVLLTHDLSAKFAPMSEPFERAASFYHLLFPAVSGRSRAERVDGHGAPSVVGLDPPFVARYTSLLHTFTVCKYAYEFSDLERPHDERAELRPLCNYERWWQLLRAAAATRNATSPLLPPPPRYVCAPRLVVGTGHRGWRYSDVRAWSRFTMRVAQSLSNVDGLHHARPLCRLSLVFFRKHGRREILNQRALVDTLRRAWPRARIDFVDPVAEVGDVDRQLRWVRRYAVVVTPPGGISITALFAAPGATVIPVQYWDAVFNRSGSMEGFVFTKASTVGVTPYVLRSAADQPVDVERVLREQPKLTRAELMAMPVADRIKDYGNLRVDAARLTELVRAAFHRASITFSDLPLYCTKEEEK